MLILTGINVNNGYIRVTDTDDRQTEDVQVMTVAGAIRSGKIKIHGLRPYRKGDMYPNDSQYWQGVDLVIVPSEAQYAMSKV